MGPWAGRSWAEGSGSAAAMVLQLHEAARTGNLQELRRLAASGMSLDERDQHNRTALHLSAWAGNVRDGGGCLLPDA